RRNGRRRDSRNDASADCESSDQSSSVVESDKRVRYRAPASTWPRIRKRNSARCISGGGSLPAYGRQDSIFPTIFAHAASDSTTLFIGSGTRTSRNRSASNKAT